MSRGEARKRFLSGRSVSVVCTALTLSAPIAIQHSQATGGVGDKKDGADAAQTASAIRFAVIGDYGVDRGGRASSVAALVKAQTPDLIITTGDNNYPLGEASTIDRNIGKLYHEFIAPYKGRFGDGTGENRFYPSLGNHDWGNDGGKNRDKAKPYLDWFELPGNERYYDFVRGPVHFFAIDSDPHEPDGVSADSKQALWLERGLRAAREPWKVVYFHHPPYTSGTRHGPCEWMRWPFHEWGASVVLAGHEHSYERLEIRHGAELPALPYFVVGTGGARSSGFGTPAEGSRKRIEGLGALIVTASDREMVFEYHAVDSEAPVDEFKLSIDRPEFRPAHSSN